jgi:acetyl-CoA synthetase (ADP-forming)
VDVCDRRARFEILVVTGRAQGVDAVNRQKRKTLSEHESKKLLLTYGVPITRELLATCAGDAVTAAKEIGFPVALKACSPDLTHKSDLGLVELGLETERAVRHSFAKIAARAKSPIDGILVQEMVKQGQELVIGMTRDRTFGPCVMFGLGGVLTEVLRDVSFRVAPLEMADAKEMMEDIRGRAILEGCRGQEPCNKDAIGELLVQMGRIGLEHSAIMEIDVNPLVVSGSAAVAVDALVVLQE